MTPGRIPRLRAPALTIIILIAALALSFALLGSLALADDTTDPAPEVSAEEAETTQPAPMTATASTSLRAHQPSDAIDGSKATHWGAISFRYPQWLKIDLGAPQRVVKSSISWLRTNKSRKYFYRLEGSLDGEQWLLLADRSKKSAFNRTNDRFDEVVQYLRVTVLKGKRGRAGIKEIKVKTDTIEGDEWAVVTPTPEPSPAPTDPGDEWAVVEPAPAPGDSPAPTPSPSPTTGSPAISGLSATHAPVGAQLTITGTGFGTTRGTSTVTFGEARVTTPSPSGGQQWAPCTKEPSSYVSWSDTHITVTVPSMSPGVAAYPSTYHRVRVYVGGVESNAADFYVDPVAVNPTGTSDVAWSAIGSEWTYRAVPRTANANTTAGVQGYDYIAPTDAWWGIHVRGSNVLFQNCTFTCRNPDIRGDYAGVVTLRSVNNVTFVNCTFKQNWSTNTVGDAWKGVNGVKAVETSGITISDCRFERFSRMSYEEVAGSSRTAIRNCSFDAPGNQVISLNEGNLYNLIDNCTFYGWGNHAEMYPSGAAGWESNQGRYVVTRDCTWWFGSQDFLNISQTPGVPSNLLFERCHMYADSAHHRADQRGVCFSVCSLLSMSGVEYARFKDCEFVTGDASMGMPWLGLTGWGASAQMWGATNNYNDFSGSTVTGYVRGNGTYVPTTAAGYFGSCGSVQFPVLSKNVPLPAKQ